MKQKKVLYRELAYVLGMLTLPLGAAMMARADFGLSMVIAPAYLLHLKISQILPAYTFGMSEYVLQAVLIAVLCVVLRKFKITYLLSFVTAVIYGVMLDLYMFLVGLLPFFGLPSQFAFYIVGLFLTALGVAFFFETYFPPEAYELFVKELTAKTGANIGKVKTIYDCCSCLISIALSFAFFGLFHFEGVKLGTIFCALINGWLIGRFSHIMETKFELRDAFPWREKMNR